MPEKKKANLVHVQVISWQRFKVIGFFQGYNYIILVLQMF